MLTTNYNSNQIKGRYLFMNFGEKLQTLRKEKNLSQELLAEMLGVSRQAVSKWESGQTYPETEKMIALSEIFGVTLDSLIKGGMLQKDENNMIAGPFWIGFGNRYEYKSKRTLFGLPLVHINIGAGRKTAKGVIAIGNIATGILAIGLLSMGVLSIGILSLGILSLGVLGIGFLFATGAISIGAFSIGAISIGMVTLGAISIGMYSFGALAVGSRVAVGHDAFAPIAVGIRAAEGARTFVETSSVRNFSSVNAEEVRSAIIEKYPGTWNWVVNWLTRPLG